MQILRVDIDGKDTSKDTSKGVDLTDQMRRIINLLSKESMSVQLMMRELDFKSRPTFLRNYLNPATESGLVELTQSDSPNSPTQKYRLTDKGRALAGN